MLAQASAATPAVPWPMKKMRWTVPSAMARLTAAGTAFSSRAVTKRFCPLSWIFQRFWRVFSTEAGDSETSFRK